MALESPVLGPYSYLFAYARNLRTQKRYRYSRLRLAHVRQLRNVRTQKVIFLRTSANIRYSHLPCVREVSRDNVLIYGAFTPARKLAYHIDEHD